MTDPMTPNQFLWFLTLATGGVSLLWLLWDVSNLRKALKLDMTVPGNRDKRFGYSIGIVIATLGIVGSARAQGWI
ncbi:hypothetical protein BH11MYX1_BH11MYX1_43370 [soil metagenome]